METLEELLVFVDSIDEELGNPLYAIIAEITERDPDHFLLHGRVCKNMYRSLGLASEEDYFLVKMQSGWGLVKNLYGIIEIGPTKEVTNAIYVQHEGKYAHAVGIFTREDPVFSRKEIPPL